MNEELPEIKLDLAGTEFIATPLNAMLFTFAGKTLLETGEVIENSSRNHVFLETHEPDPETTVVTGTYIFEPDFVQRLGTIMVTNGFPCRLNHREIPVCDEDSYQMYVNQQETADDFGDFLPEGWA